MMYVERWQKAQDTGFQGVSLFSVFITAVHILWSLLLAIGNILKMKGNHCSSKEGKEVEIAL